MSGCKDCDTPCGDCCGSSGEYRADCYDQSLIPPGPTAAFQVGDYVRSTLTGEWGKVVRVTWHMVWFEEGGRRLGFPPKCLTHACGQCGSVWDTDHCSAGCLRGA